MEKEILERLITYVLKLLGKRNYTENEIKTKLNNYMYKKKIGDREVYITEVVEFLHKRKFLNDTYVAEAFVRDRQLLRPRSRKMMRVEMKRKGLSNELIDKELERYDEEEALKKLIAKKKQYPPEKLIQYLLQQGFPYNSIKRLVLTKACD